MRFSFVLWPMWPPLAQQQQQQKILKLHAAQELVAGSANRAVDNDILEICYLPCCCCPMHIHTYITCNLHATVVSSATRCNAFATIAFDGLCYVNCFWLQNIFTHKQNSKREHKTHQMLHIGVGAVGTGFSGFVELLK